MKNINFLIAALLLLACHNLKAQGSLKDPVTYLNKVSEGQAKVNSDFLSYISTVAHSKSAKKVAQKRSELLTTVSTARARVSNMKDFEGDTMLRHAAYNYFNITYVVLKEDFAKIMDLEEIAEQSYDNMEAYITMQKKASDKVEEAFDMCNKEFHNFGKKNNITIQEQNTEESKKVEKVNSVMDYYNKVYLAFFKCNKGEFYMVDASSKKDLNAIEQTKASLAQAITESTTKLITITSFDGDESLLKVSKKLIDFYQSEIKENMPVLADYLMKNEKFEKLKKAMEKKAASEKTKEDVDQYNAAVNELNTAVNAYNKMNTDLNNTRTRLVNEWNKVATGFLDKHMPVYKN